MDWKRKFTSRRFWTSVAAFVTLMIKAFGYSDNLASEVAAIIMAGAAVIAYIIGEGLVDASREEVTLIETEPDPVEEDVETVQPESEE
jgi:hypothetical protein